MSNVESMKGERNHAGMLVRIICILEVLVLMISLIVILISNYYISYNYLFVGVSVVIAYLAYCLADHKDADVAREGFIVLLIFYNAVVLRLILFIFLKNNLSQVSDFAQVLTEAQYGDWKNNASYYMVFPRKVLYPILLNKIGLRSEESIIIFQIFLEGAVAAIITGIGIKEIGKKAGTITGFLLTVMPSQVLYVFITNEEILSRFIVTLMILSALLLIRTIQSNMNAEKRIVRVVILCIAMGLLKGFDLYIRRFSSIVVLALFLVLAVECFCKKNRDRILLIVLGAVLVFSSDKITSWEIKNCIEGQLETTVSDSSIGFTMYMAANPKYDGCWNPEVVDIYFQKLSQYNNDVEATERWAFRELYSDTIGNKDRILPLLRNKLISSYGSNKAFLDWFYGTLKEERREDIYNILSVVDNTIYLMIFIFVVVGSLMNISVKNLDLVFLNLIIVGGLILNVIILESQGRYKSSVYMIWILLASWGMHDCFTEAKKAFWSGNEKSI